MAHSKPDDKCTLNLYQRRKEHLLHFLSVMAVLRFVGLFLVLLDIVSKQLRMKFSAASGPENYFSQENIRASLKSL